MQIQYKAPPTIEAFMRSDARRRAIMGPVGCLPADSEYLTPTGWKRLDAYVEGDLVAEFDTRDNTARFRAPLSYIRQTCESFLHLKNRYGLDQLLSDEHTVLFNTRFQPDKWQTVSARELAAKHDTLKDGWSGRIPTTFKIEDRLGVDLTDDEFRLMIAVCADGYFPPHHASERRCRICVRKERKKVRLRGLLVACEIEWTEHTYAGRPTETTFSFLAPLKTKTLGTFWGASLHQFAILLEEMVHWDGFVDEYGASVFTSNDCASADVVQFAAAVQGFRATSTPCLYPEHPAWKPTFRVYLNRGATELSLRQAPKIERVASQDGFKYCFETSTGFFVARHNGRIFLTGNSGKSSGSVVEIARRAMQQRQDPRDGKRRTRFAVVRNTNRELKDTTIKTFFDWFPPGIAGSWHETAMTFKLAVGDVECEILFRPLDTPDDVKRLLSLEISGSWINEARELPREIAEGLDSRIGRYPSVRNGGCTWRGIWADTNPPEEESYWYRVIEGLDLDTGDPLMAGEDNGWERFVQPGGRSPNAENVEHLDPGYYENIVNGKSEEWVRVYVDCNYGRSKGGKPVFALFNRDLHVAKKMLVPNRHIKVILGADAGLTPAVVFLQRTLRGQLLVLDECYHMNCGAVRFIDQHLKPHITREGFSGLDMVVAGDPAMTQRSQSDEKMVKEVYKDKGFKIWTPGSNALAGRVTAVDNYLAGITEDGPAFLVSPKCRHLIRALEGGYRYAMRRDGRVNDEPEKNEWSHVAEALQYGAMYHGDPVADKAKDERRKQLIAQQRAQAAGAYSRRA